MSDTQVSIGQVKRDISELVNRVAFGGERVLLTSRGKPKAAIVSLADYERLQRADAPTQLEQWQTWLADHQALTARILAARGGELFDADTVWADVRRDLEERHDDLLGA